jgi:hypothetical protein
MSAVRPAAVVLLAALWALTAAGAAQSPRYDIVIADVPERWPTSP